MKYSVDSKCLELARYFYPEDSDNDLMPLAQQFQDAAEGFEIMPSKCDECGEGRHVDGVWHKPGCSKI